MLTFTLQLDKELAYRQFHFKIDHKYISGETEITNSFNKYFSKIGKTTSENLLIII
jgi:hypothetical protein